MTAINRDSLVSVFRTTTEADAEVVCNMLSSNGIRATVAESEGPFAGATVAPSEVLVWADDANRASELIKKAGHKHE